MYDAWVMIGQMLVEYPFRKMVYDSLDQSPMLRTGDAAPKPGGTVKTYYSFCLQPAAANPSEDPLYTIRERMQEWAPGFAAMPIGLGSIAQIAWTFGRPLLGMPAGAPRTTDTARAGLDALAKAIQGSPDTRPTTIDSSTAQGRDNLAMLGSLVCDGNLRTRLRKPTEPAPSWVKALVNDPALEVQFDAAGGVWDNRPICGLRTDVWTVPVLAAGAE